MTPKKPSPKIKVRKIYSKHIPTLTGIALLIGGVAIGFFIFGNVYESQLYTEIISLIITIIVLDRLNEWRTTTRSAAELKERLLREAGSRSNDIATSAMDWMRNERWIYGKESLLNQANLRRANLEKIYLKGASMVNTHLHMANLHRANLTLVDFRHATLQRANLSHAHLMKSSLRNADLRRADLRHANLSGADLRGANLTEARLSHGTNIDGILIDATCVLPNGLLYEPSGKSVEEQFMFLQDEILLNAELDYDESGIELEAVMQGKAHLSRAKAKARPQNLVHDLMQQIHELADEDLDDLLEQLDVMAHPEMYLDEDDDMSDIPLAFAGDVEELLDDVEDHEFSFLVKLENDLEDDATKPDKPATFTDDIHHIFTDIDDTSLNFLRNISDQLRSDPKSVDSDDTPTRPSPPENRASRLRRDDQQGYH